MPFILFYRNQAYQASKQLAVSDNNAHCLRDQASNKAGTAIHARKFRKQSKKCDVAPVKKTKEYSYMNPVKKTKEYSYMNQIIEEMKRPRQNSSQSLKKERLLLANHHYYIQHTNGDSDPHYTSIQY